jgi:hypothetical protein
MATNPTVEQMRAGVKAAVAARDAERKAENARALQFVFE